MSGSPFARRVAAVLAALALGSFTAAPAGATQAGESRKPSPGRGMKTMASPPKVELPAGGTELPMLSFGGRPVVELMIGGKGPYRFILDSGAGQNLVDTGFAKEAGLPEVGRTTVQSPVADKAVEVAQVSMDEVRLGEILIHGMRASTMDLASYFGPDGPHGVLSAYTFRGSLLVYDYPGKTIAIRPGKLPPADGRRVFEWGEHDGLPTVPLEVAGTVIPTHLDTGSPSTFTLPGRYMKSLPLASDPVVRGKARLVDTEVTLYAAPLAGTVRLGEYAFENPQIVFGDRFPAGNIGHGIMQHLRVTFDLEHRRVKLDGDPLALAASVAGGPAGAAAGPVRIMRKAPTGGQRKRYGLAVIPKGGEALVVDFVEPGSPAEAAGVKAGDRIVEVNGEPARGMDQARLALLFHSSPLTLVIERDGKRRTLEMRLPD